MQPLSSALAQNRFSHDEAHLFVIYHIVCLHFLSGCHCFAYIYIMLNPRDTFNCLFRIEPSVIILEFLKKLLEFITRSCVLKDKSVITAFSCSNKHSVKVKSMQRSGTEAIQPSKPKREITYITNSQNTKRTYGQPNEQLFPCSGYKFSVPTRLSVRSLCNLYNNYTDVNKKRFSEY